MTIRSRDAPVPSNDPRMSGSDAVALPSMVSAMPSKVCRTPRSNSASGVTASTGTEVASVSRRWRARARSARKTPCASPVRSRMKVALRASRWRRRAGLQHRIFPQAQHRRQRPIDRDPVTGGPRDLGGVSASRPLHLREEGHGAQGHRQCRAHGTARPDGPDPVIDEPHDHDAQEDAEDAVAGRGEVRGRAKHGERGDAEGVARLQADVRNL